MNHNEQIKKAIKDCLTVKIEFLFHGKMPWDEPTSKATRDVYLVTLTNENGKTYQTQYGQSLVKSDPRKMSDDALKCYFSNSKDYHDFKDGLTLRKKIAQIEKPSIADVLYSIERNDPETFEDFCSNFGYNNDSIKAHKIYIEAQKQYYFMKSLPCIEKINEILQDY